MDLEEGRYLDRQRGMEREVGWGRGDKERERERERERESEIERKGERRRVCVREKASETEIG